MSLILTGSFTLHAPHTTIVEGPSSIAIEAHFAKRETGGHDPKTQVGMASQKVSVV